MSAPCSIAGNPDLYGLGIRVSFYLIWISTLCLNPIEEGYIAILFIGELVLDAAVFLGLVIAASGGYLHAVEVYIAILLLSTTVYLLFPRHAADLAMAFCPHLGLRTKKRIYQNYVAAARLLYTIVVGGLQMWFWISGVNDSHIHRMLTDTDETGCQQFGFLFGPVDLHNSALKALHIIVLLLATAAGILIEWKFWQRRIQGKSRRKIRSRWTIQKWVEAMGGLVVASTSITAIELTIKWNHIPAVVNQATTAAQLIPLLLVVALIVTFLYAYVRSTSCADSSSDSDGGITLSFPSSPSGGGRRPTFSSGGSGSEPPIVIVRQGRSRSRTQSEPEIIRVFYPSPTHRRTRPRGPRPPPERDRPSSPGGDSVRGPRIIDVRPPPRPSSSSSSSSSSSGFDPRVNICRYPPYYQFPHIFRRPPLQSSSTTPAASAPTRTNTTTIAILGGSGWRHIATNEDPNQLRPIPHPQAASPVRASSSAPRVLAYLDRSESLSPRRPSPETISSTVGSTEEAAAGAASEPPVSAPAAPAEQAASEPVGASEPAAGAEPAEQTADRKEAQLDSEMKEEEHHNKLWEEFRNPKPILTGEDIEQVMAGPPDILTDAEIDSCLRADSVLSDAEVEAYMASRKGFFDKEDVAATMKGTSYYCDEDVKAADAGRISQEEVDEVVKKGLMTDSEVEDLLHPQIRQPTVEEEGGLSTTARVGAEYNITTDVKMDTVSEDEGGEESGVTILEIPKK